MFSHELIEAEEVNFMVDAWQLEDIDVRELLEIIKLTLHPSSTNE
jgi:hypothetical protein